MEILIKLTESELDEVVAGAASAKFTFYGEASGTNPGTSGTATIRTTPSSASVYGSVSSHAGGAGIGAATAPRH